MKTEPLFTVPELAESSTVKIIFEQYELTVPAGINVAAALLLSGVREFRTSVVGQAPRAPYCMMGVCFECLVEIDGIPARQSCVVTVKDGMHVRRQIGAPELDPLGFGEEA